MLTCTAPDIIQEGDLSAYIDGEATADVVAHLATCAFCQAEVAALREMSGLFGLALQQAPIAPPQPPPIPVGLPAEMALFNHLLAAQPKPVQAAFQYALCLLMVAAGQMEKGATIPGEERPLVIFQADDGERFAIPKPLLSAADEAQVLAEVRQMIKDKGLL